MPIMITKAVLAVARACQSSVEAGSLVGAQRDHGENSSELVVGHVGRASQRGLGDRR